MLLTAEDVIEEVRGEAVKVRCKKFSRVCHFSHLTSEISHLTPTHLELHQLLLLDRTTPFVDIRL